MNDVLAKTATRGRERGKEDSGGKKGKTRRGRVYEKERNTLSENESRVKAAGAASTYKLRHVETDVHACNEISA